MLEMESRARGGVALNSCGILQFPVSNTLLTYDRHAINVPLKNE